MCFCFSFQGTVSINNGQTDGCIKMVLQIQSWMSPSWPSRVWSSEVALRFSNFNQQRKDLRKVLYEKVFVCRWYPWHHWGLVVSYSWSHNGWLYVIVFDLDFQHCLVLKFCRLAFVAISWIAFKKLKIKCTNYIKLIISFTPSIWVFEDTYIVVVVVVVVVHPVHPRFSIRRWPVSSFILGSSGGFLGCLATCRGAWILEPATCEGGSGIHLERVDFLEVMYFFFWILLGWICWNKT